LHRGVEGTAEISDYPDFTVTAKEWWVSHPMCTERHWNETIRTDSFAPQIELLFLGQLLRYKPMDMKEK
jgi:hypothetical protein